MRKYYLKTLTISLRNKVLYISLILSLKIKQEGLQAIGLTLGQISDIYTSLKTEYNK